MLRCVISVEPPPPPPPVELIVIPPLPDETVTFVPPINAGIPVILSYVICDEPDTTPSPNVSKKSAAS